jgi:hypothetical protein
MIWTPESIPLDAHRRRLRPERVSRFEGRGQLLSPEGDVLWEDPDWIPNALHDAGEESMLNVYLREQANPAKHLGLLNDASVAETAEKTFGPISGSSLVATHASLSTTSTGAGILIATVALSGTTTVNVGQSFKYTLRWKQQ